MSAPEHYSNEIIKKVADNIRILSVAMVEKANSGHPGGAMGGADFVSVLFTEFLNEDPDDPRWFYRDRFFMDPGHMSPMLYSILAMSGKYTMDDLSNFRQWGSPTPGHPELDFGRGVENTSGPLGQGHTNAVGAAVAEKFLTNRFGPWMSHKIYTFISDGGVQEEIAQGAGRIAGHLGLSNLIMFFDSNDIQLSTTVDEVTTEDFEAKYRAWGWHVITIKGNDIDEIRAALIEANAEEDRPTLIIGKTIMGFGAVDAQGNSFEGQVSTHGQPLSNAGGDANATISRLGGDPENPFQIFPDVKELFEGEVYDRKRRHVEMVNEQTEDWANFSADDATLLKSYIAGEGLQVDFGSIQQKEGVATRAASSTVLGVFADQIGNMIVASADLSNSDKTDGFLKKTKALKKGDFSGAFLQAGVAELTMAAMANGMALHGGVIPVVGTFFVFSDFMKPAVRLAALMKLPVKYVWTHDAFRVGEDGPTHQPVEHEAQIRLLEQLKNHDGENSLLVLRPADADETTVAWKMALANTATPTALILSRQNIKKLPSSGSRYEAALQAENGGYIIVEGSGSPDIVLLASGSEVATCVEAAEVLLGDGVTARVVSIPSEGLFRNQTVEYQNSVLPVNVPRFGLTAGLPSTLAGLVGSNGVSVGLDHFGYSAPASVLDEKFGFTGDQVAIKVKAFLGK